MFGEKVADFVATSDDKPDTTEEELSDGFHSDISAPLETSDVTILLPDVNSCVDLAKFIGITATVCAPTRPLHVLCRATEAMTLPPKPEALIEFFGKIVLPGRIVTEFVSGVAQNDLLEFDWTICSDVSLDKCFETIGSATSFISVPTSRLLSWDCHERLWLVVSADGADWVIEPFCWEGTGKAIAEVVPERLSLSVTNIKLEVLTKVALSIVLNQWVKGVQVYK